MRPLRMNQRWCRWHSQLLAWTWCLLATVGHASVEERGQAAVTVLPVGDIANVQNTSLLQDTAGRIWVGNATRLLRHDGARWRSFGAKRPLRYHRVISADADRVFVISEGELGWFEANGRGDYVFRSERARLPAGPAFEDYLGAVEDGGALWIKARTRYLYLPRTGPALEWPSADGLRPFRARGQIWVVGGTPGIRSLRVEGDRLVAEPVPGADALAGRTIVGVADLGSAGVVLVDRSGAVLRWRERVASAERSPVEVAELAALGPQSVLALADGGYAIGFLRGGVYVYGRDGELRERHRGPRIGGASVYAMLEDREGGLWLAQDHAIRRVDRRSGLTAFNDEVGINSARRLLRHQSRLYAAGMSGIYVLNAGVSPRFELLTPAFPVVVDALSTGRSLLLATGRLVRLRVDADGRITDTLTLATGPGAIRTLRASRFHPGRVYAGGDGFVLVVDDIEAAMPRWRRIDGLEGRSEGLAEESAEWIWASALRHGPWRLRLHPDGSLAERITLGAEHGRRAGESMHVQPGRDAVWFAGQHAIQRFDAATQRLIDAPLPGPARTRNAFFFRLIEDSDGHLWTRLEDRFGVYWREPGGYRWDESVLGPHPATATVNDVLREAQIVWIARSDGVLRLDLSARQPPEAPAALLIDRLTDVRVSTDLPLDRAQLRADQRDLQISYALPSHLRADGIRYRSRLWGYDADWSEWSAAAERRYTNLPDGELRFAIEARDALGREVAPRELRLWMSAPWWRSGWALAGYALALLVLLWLSAQLAVRRRQGLLLARQQALEALIAERTQALADSNRQLAEQAERLRQVDALKSRFFANVSHEFRTPLTLVLGPLDDVLSASRVRLGERTRELLELASRNARRVLDLIVELLDVNRLENGQLPLRRAPHELRSLVTRCVDAQQALVERHGHQLHCTLPEAPQTAEVDALQIERCLSNLIANAAKYTPRGGRIEVSVLEDGSWVRIEVRDNGRGIPASALSQVYDRFFQSTHGAATDGVGIGLALVRELIELHGGRVGVHSELGIGSRFWFDLPRSSATPLPVPATPEAEPMLPLPVSGAPRALVIDDHADLRLHLRALLQASFEVIEAADGSDGLRLARSELPDVIVSDVMMPGFDGVEFARRLRADPSTAAIPLLLLTARAGAAHAVEGLSAGADDYLGKPFDASELLARLEALIAMRRRLQYRLQREAPPLPPVPAGPEERWRERMDQILAARIGDSSFSIDAWAEALHTDRTTLFRRMKTLLGTSPSEYLREARLRRAHELLTSGAGNVTEVAYAVGFESLSSFARAFRAMHGCAPSELLCARRDGVA